MMTQEAKPVTAAIREPEAAASLRREGNTRLEEKAVIRENPPAGYRHAGNRVERPAAPPAAAGPGDGPLRRAAVLRGGTIHDDNEL